VFIANCYGSAEKKRRRMAECPDLCGHLVRLFSASKDFE